MDAARCARPPVRVLVVDDSVVVRRMVGRAVEADPVLELAGVAANGRLALAKLTAVRPDVVVLDLEMPVMDGFEALASIRHTHPDLPVIVFSNLTVTGAKATLDAMALGATAFALKPVAERSPSPEGLRNLERIGDDLIPLIKALASSSAEVVAPATTCRTAPIGTGHIEVVVVAVSTGGPTALDVVLRTLPADLAAPVLIVQHMPPDFTRLLAERLDSRAALEVVEAEHGMVVRRGRVYIAPGGHHMGVRRVGTQVCVALNDGPAENACRPAADVLFRSAVETYGGEVLGVVLTGMGRDGLRGSEAVRAAGGAVIAQSRASSVVASMPGAVVDAELADAVVDIDEVGPEVRRRVNRAG